MLTYLIEPWENVVEIKPNLGKIETNSQFAQIIAPSDMIALVTLSFKVGTSEGLLNFAIPHMVIEPIMERLNTKYWFRQADDENTDAYWDDMENQLESAMVPVSAEVGSTSLTVEEFIHLQVGDVIPLDSYANTDINIMIGSLLKFQGKPGISRGKNAVQVTTLLGKEEQ
jgi:flagellar motor switch protein FliM